MRLLPPQFLLSRLTFIGLLLTVLGLIGLYLLFFRWAGHDGAPPTTHLFVQGDFRAGQPLAWLERVEEATDLLCYRVQVAPDLAPESDLVSEPLPADDAEGNLLCAGQRRVVRVGEARLELGISGGGTPSVSVAGFHPRTGDWLGSWADPRRGQQSPRFPLRGDGVPGRAAQVVECPGSGGAVGSAARLCLRLEDRLGRTAVVKKGGALKNDLTFGDPVELAADDRLWLGLLELRVLAAADGLYFEREPLLRPGGRQNTDALSVLAEGGDRRWLGRPGHLEVPDPATYPTPVERYEIYPMRDRYNPAHLSRQRTNFEGEDTLQLLIDGGWLCLEPAVEDLPPRVDWRPLHRPGCADSIDMFSPQSTSAQPTSAVALYRRARYGDMAFLTHNLLATVNRALAERLYLEDPTALPFAFEWWLVHDSRRGDLSPQPWPRTLWGVRFGTTRQQQQAQSAEIRPLPDIVPRASTALQILQVWRGEDLAASFYLPATSREGSLCLGRPRGESWQDYKARAGSHLPLGSVAFSRDPREGAWTSDPAAGCGGCRLRLTATGAVADPEACRDLEHTGPGRFIWGPFQIHTVRREPPWLATTDRGDGRRHFAQEMYVEAGLAPLLGDAAGLSGVEAALRRHRDRGGASAPQYELTVDGDLQLAALSVVDHHARHLIKSSDEDEKVKVSAVILDARNGALLSVVNWSRAGSDALAHDTWIEPTAWELGSAQATGAQNLAFTRRGAVGSTMKITAAYTLLNNQLPPGSDTKTSDGGVREVPREETPKNGRDGKMGLARVEGGPGSPAWRGCSSRHVLPTRDRHFNQGTFVQRFANSCNNFFVLAGLRHASAQPLALEQLRPGQRATPPPDRLSIESANGRLVLRQPSFDHLALADRFRAGLAADTASPALPRSWFGVLYRLGFQPRPRPTYELIDKVASSLRFDHRGTRVTLPLVDSWFTSATAPTLEAGRQFAYPSVPSPGRFDEVGSTEEVYGSQPFTVQRGDEGFADVQYSMLLIGQADLELSALGLAVLYAPAVRTDGRAIQPCLFVEACGDQRVGEKVLDSEAAPILHEALQAVLDRTVNGTAAPGLEHSKRLRAVGWGGKTGTFEVDVPQASYGGMNVRQWRRLKAHLCGVGGVPPMHYNNPAFPDLTQLAAAGHGRGRGARACEKNSWPLNPGGIQRYHDDALPPLLDEVEKQFARPKKDKQIFKSFVMAATPMSGSAVQGLIVAVIVDYPAAGDGYIAVKIGSDLAATAGRWAEVAGR